MYLFLTLKDCSDMNAPFIIKSIAYSDPVFLHGSIKIQFKIQLFSVQWSFCILWNRCKLHLLAVRSVYR